jgi:hypothetical protein
MDALIAGFVRRNQIRVVETRAFDDELIKKLEEITL